MRREGYRLLESRERVSPIERPSAAPTRGPSRSERRIVEIQSVMESPARPRTKELIGEGFLAMIWEDGHESIYDAALLRANCPCAECRTRRERLPSAEAKTSGLSLAMAPPGLVGLEDVGRYAVRLRWSDGHATGLFEFRLLRELCPCDACRGREADCPRGG